MTTKPEPGDDSDRDSGSGDDSSPPRSHRPENFEPGSRHISVDPEGMLRSAGQFRGAGDNFRSFVRDLERLIGYAPLVNGEEDEPWKEFEPSYTGATQVFVDGVSGLAGAVDQMCESLRQFAAFCVATEDNAEYLGKNALGLNESPDPAGVPGPTREGYQPLTPMRSVTGEELPAGPSGRHVPGKRP
ncbi:WXG100 family type VII secretion target [Saccharopolyspora elongata]|uniref:WXG100 family type VII secretion target n=1 Tax=Saccharopolyspora elongata TaxID=2530387 RepID=A0A4R4YCI3_9PSEU|nr:hypothetical protein [Saccharopolyspora elongata]TDD42378.1 hypothetical protein E1288_29720 [Saccharopolyspora elongata]